MDKKSNVWTESTNAHALMKTALGHYSDHRKMVYKKLEIAHKAHLKYKLKALLKREKSFGKKIGIYRKYLKGGLDSSEAKVWAEVKSNFNTRNISENDLFHIEDMLVRMPQEIKEVYVEKCKKDKALNNIIKAVDHDSYHKAKDRIQKVQNKPNPLTGMTAENYQGSLLDQIKNILFDSE
ncbi:MAG: hypothetical protein KTR28_08490 [Micavibrio sp.]|nr:hypothetical protein [Micavibrio sp.]